ncbi:MAG: hypothetical protein U5K29_00660 [Acidimicrobiales bacterium]|nr:hypothetical protein [Acidimicrobiales bacterium]
MNKRTIGAGLLVLGVVLLLAGWWMWQAETENVAAKQRAEDLIEAYDVDLGRDEPEPDRTPAIAVFGFAAFSGIAGVIFLAAPPDSTPTSSRGGPPT